MPNATQTNRTKADAEVQKKIDGWVGATRIGSSSEYGDPNALHYTLLDASNDSTRGLTVGYGKVVFDGPVDDPDSEIMSVKVWPRL